MLALLGITVSYQTVLYTCTGAVSTASRVAGMGAESSHQWCCCQQLTDCNNRRKYCRYCPCGVSICDVKSLMNWDVVISLAVTNTSSRLIVGYSHVMAVHTGYAVPRVGHRSTLAYAARHNAHHILHVLQVAQAESTACSVTPEAWGEAPRALLYFVVAHMKTVTGMLQAAA